MYVTALMSVTLMERHASLGIEILTWVSIVDAKTKLGILLGVCFDNQFRKSASCWDPCNKHSLKSDVSVLNLKKGPAFSFLNYYCGSALD